MDVFNNLKELLNVNILNTNVKKKVSNVDYHTGAEILTHYQNNWQDMHEINETNAQTANKLANRINSLHTQVAMENEHLNRLNSLLNAEPSLGTYIERCTMQITTLFETFDTTEKAILDLEDLVEQCDLIKMKHNHKYQLDLYKEKKLEGLEKKRAKLSMQHEQNIRDNEFRKKKMLQERQQVFQDAFKNDLETYKNLGSLPKIDVKSQPSALLEEIHLDIDDKELNAFLEETQ